MTKKTRNFLLISCLLGKIRKFVKMTFLAESFRDSESVVLFNYPDVIEPVINHFLH